MAPRSIWNREPAPEFSESHISNHTKKNKQRGTEIKEIFVTEFVGTLLANQPT